MQKNKFSNILIIGAGYVGFSLALLLSQSRMVKIFDIDKSKLYKIKEGHSPIDDHHIHSFIQNHDLDLRTSDDLDEDILFSDIAILALPTNFNQELKSFDTSVLELTIKKIIKLNSNTSIVIKSTVPIGFTERMRSLYPTANITFSPEFLREGSALNDNISPQRIIVGSLDRNAQDIAALFLSIAVNDPMVFFMGSSEAEAVKLFSNSYLANRVSFFNELDSFALERNLNTKLIIDGVMSDSRIGTGYANPSFGYGGYCLPKDVRQLESDFQSTPQEIFSSTIKSNISRKEYIAKKIISMRPSIIGIYRLIMKSQSDNFRESAIIHIILMIQNLEPSIKIIIYEPKLQSQFEHGCKVMNSLDKFINSSELIIANRMDDLLESARHKVFTRDIYGNN